MSSSASEAVSIGEALSPAESVSAGIKGGDHHLFITELFNSARSCHGFWHNAALVVPSALFLVYLGFYARKNLRKLRHARSSAIIAYYVLLWFAAFLNFAWSSLQAWQCVPGKEVFWNLLSVIAASGMLCLEISLMAFLLREDYAAGLETPSRTFLTSGVIVGVDILLKVIFIFGFHVPLFVDVQTTHWGKWSIWCFQKSLLTAAYGYILFVHFSKWRDKLPPRPGFYNYVIALLAINAVFLLASGLAGFGFGFGLGLYEFTVVCYHSLYLPFLYTTFLADFFEEEEWILDNAYYSEMKDAGFFDAEWE